MPKIYEAAEGDNSIIRKVTVYQAGEGYNKTDQPMLVLTPEILMHDGGTSQHAGHTATPTTKVNSVAHQQVMSSLAEHFTAGEQITTLGDMLDVPDIGHGIVVLYNTSQSVEGMIDVLKQLPPIDKRQFLSAADALNTNTDIPAEPLPVISESFAGKIKGQTREDIAAQYSPKHTDSSRRR